MAMTDPLNTSINLPFNASSLFEEEAKEVDKVNRIMQDSGGTNGTTNATANYTENCYESPYLRSIYPFALPVMIFFCVLSIFVNVLIVASARWCRRPMTPTLYFSISLALADAVASIALATGLIVNSLLPCVFDINIVPQKPNCVTLVIEIFRLGCILITVKHLLALGVNHWIGIVRPLHYAATMTRRTAWLVIVISWACPILFLFAYFSAHPGQGFLTEDCRTVAIFNKKTFRVIFASLFFAPLLVMSMIYLHIFLIVKNHHQHRLRYQVSCQTCSDPFHLYASVNFMRQGSSFAGTASRANTYTTTATATTQSFQQSHKVCPSEMKGERERVNLKGKLATEQSSVLLGESTQRPVEFSYANK